jgi:hypothetical protein
MDTETPAERERIAKLRERYVSLRLSTQEDFEDDAPSMPLTPSESPINSPSPSKKGKKRWSLLKTAILMIPEKSGSTRSGMSEKEPSSSKSTTPAPEEEADRLLAYWNSDAPVEGAPLDISFPDLGEGWEDEGLADHSRTLEDGDEDEEAEERRPAESSAAVALAGINYVDAFAAESKNVSLVISKVPEEVIRKKKEQLDAEVIAEKRRDAEGHVKGQANLLFLENAARERVQRLQDEALVTVKKERSDMVAELHSREASIGREFRRAREALEADLGRQQAALSEKHGQQLSGDPSISRRFEVQWTVAPQPVEMRVHVMRAVKNKLPKGSYVVMLTQYDRLGGRPLVWSVSGGYGIDKDRPATTRPFKHHGRFFDRVLKVEDSVFALCPPAERLKPGNVFILELFQLATRRNPVNRVIGWAALPMCTPQFSVVEGRFKLPILRGEHTPSIQHYRTIEHSIGEDLNNWLCNIYVEVKHLPKVFMNRDGTSMDEYQIEFNFMKKLLSIGNNGADQKGEEDIEAGHSSRGGELDPLMDRQRKPPSSSSSTNNHYIGRAKQQQQQAAVASAGSKASSGAYPINLEGYPEVDEDDPDIEDDHYHDFSKTNNSEMGGTMPNVDPANLKYGRSTGGSSTAPVGIARQRGKSSGSGGGQSTGQFSLNVGEDDSQRKSRGSNSSFWSSMRSVFVREVSKGNDNDEKETLLNDPDSNGNTRASAVRFENSSGGGSGRGGAGRGQRIWGNGMTTDEDDDEEEDQVEVLERGYDPEDEFFLDSQQIGKLAGLETIGKEEDRQWAASGITNGIVRRWQSDGSRYDSEAVRDAGPSPAATDLEEKRRKMLGEIDDKGRFTTWTPLSDKKDFDLYSVAVSSDPSRRRKLLPTALVKSKMRFILQEAVGDLWFENWGSFDFYVTVFAYIVTLWLRMVIHYIGQYFFLLAVQTPVYSFKLDIFEIIFKYISTAVPVTYEVALIAVGPLSNIFVFICLAFVSRMFYRFAGSLPDSISLLVCAFGVWTVLDPVAIFLVDVASHNYRCGDYDAQCREDYTSSSCDCFNGDWFKLWTRYHRDEGSGMTGMFITFMIYFATTICGLLLLYEYLVRIHKDARIMDIWRRINAPAEDLFLPLDFEISLDELRTICAHAAAWKGPEGASRRLVVSEYVETDPFDDSFKATTKHFAIYELMTNGKRKLYRHFLKLQDGSIIEIFEQLSIDLSTQYRLVCSLFL